MELSLNMSEDENCTFITTNLLEQTDNFDEWLDKNGVQYIITNECLNDNLINNQLDPLLNQINPNESFDNLSDTETNLIKQIIISKPKHQQQSTSSRTNHFKRGAGSTSPSISIKFKTLTSKMEYIEDKFTNGIYVRFTPTNSKILLTFTDIDDTPIHYPELNISLQDSGGHITIPKDRVSVESLQHVELAADLNATMPCLHLYTGLRLFICPMPHCELVFTRLGPAKMHALVEIGHKPYKCTHLNCTWAFYNSFKLKRHQECHTNTKDFVCHVNNCGRKFTNVYNLNIHVKKTHERPATLQCFVKDCSLKFQTSRLREKHFKTHDAVDAPFRCPKLNCTKSFFILAGLTSHARIHSHKESDLKCDYPNCGKVFEQPCRLKEHIRKHTGQRPYSCAYDQCKWTFTTASKLKRHQSTHTKERKFHCTIGTCNKSFLRSEHLKDHTLTHIGQRSFQCEVCGASFFGKSSMQLHIKKMHPDLIILASEETNNTLITTISQINENDLVDQAGEEGEKPTAEMLLEQAIQSLGVPSDMILGTGLLPEEPLELLENENFSTVNLRDLD